MNLLPLLLAFVAFQAFSKKNGSGSQKNKNPFEDLGKSAGMDGLGDLFGNPEAFSGLAGAAKLFDKNATQEEKTSAILALLANPAVFEIVSKMFAGGGDKTPFGPLSEESQEAFKPVSNIAGVEISDKLCHLYDTWYTKK